MNFGIPQTILIGMWSLGLLIHILMHNKPRKDEYNGWIAFIARAVWVGLLYWGGFFR